MLPDVRTRCVSRGPAPRRNTFRRVVAKRVASGRVVYEGDQASDEGSRTCAHARTGCYADGILCGRATYDLDATRQMWDFFVRMSQDDLPVPVDERVA